MARNGSGTYNLPTGNPVVTGTSISSSTHNTTMTDIATALSASIVEDGQNPFTANQPMGGFKLTGLGAATARTDAMSLANAQDGTGVYTGTVGGTADVITLTLSPVITAYAAGQRFSFIASGANTTNVTVNVNSVGAKAVTKNGTTALVANDILSGMIVVIEYDGTQFQLITQANLVDKSSTQTVAGVKTFSGANVHSGNNTFSGNNTHSGISTFSGTIAGGTPFVFEGTTADAFETSLVVTDPTADRTITVPDADVDLTLVRAASETATGVVEKATAAENAALTDDTRYVTPAGLKEAFVADGSPPMFACRAWVSFTQVGTQAIDDNGNVSSIVDNASGDTTINFSTSMPDVNYCPVLGNQSIATGGHQVNDNRYLTLYCGATKLVGSVRVNSQYGNTNSGDDMEACFVAIFR